MTIQYEIKSQLAKLLATEDLVVEHKKVETASFNVHSRVLTLPMWDNTTEDVVDMLVSHEVGHALFTPNEEWYKEYKINPSIVNIVEDARIEKLMKRRYEGITKTFYKGYNTLCEEDFFEVKKKDISRMSLADRINLFFKIGSHYIIYFTDFEQTLVDRVASCETFKQVLEVSKLINDYCLEEIEKKKEEMKMNNNSELDMGDTEDGEDGFSVKGDSDDEQDGDTDGDDSEETSEEESGDITESTMQGGNSPVEIPMVETVESLENAIKNLAKMDGIENRYLELPDVDTSKIIISNERIHNLISEHFASLDEDIEEESSYESEWKIIQRKASRNFIVQSSEDYVKFKRDAQKEVNYLVKEFERRKSAGAYARATTSRTGILDTKNLHTYKFNDDLFKKVTLLPDGKNHGLVFVLDWSGSMSREMLDTIKQLYNLIWFCTKLQIPFEVYAFTQCFPNQNEETGLMETSYEPKDGLFVVDRNFSLMNLFTSKVRGRKLDDQLKNLFTIVGSFSNYEAQKVVPLGMGLSGTPLNESIVALHKIIPQFRKENNVEKVNCVILTDGEAYPLHYHNEVHRSWEDEPYLGTRNVGSNCFLRNRKTGKTYKSGAHYSDFTPILLRDICDTLPDVNFIGIRIMPSREIGNFLRQNMEDWNAPDFYKNKEYWRKTKTVALKGTGYHIYFGLCSSALSNDTEFEVDEDATKSQIKRAFTKSLSAKKMNKKILSQFVDLIA